MLFPDNCCQKLKKKVFYSLVWLPMECKVMFCLFLSQICCKWFILFGTNVLRPNWKFHKDSKWNHSPLHQDITWQRYPRFFTLALLPLAKIKSSHPGYFLVKGPPNQSHFSPWKYAEKRKTTKRQRRPVPSEIQCSLNIVQYIGCVRRTVTWLTGAAIEFLKFKQLYSS